MSRRIHLNAFAMNCAGHQSAGLWRHPSDEGFRYTDVEHWVDLARVLEDAGFDALFLADVLGIYDVYGGSRDAALRAGTQVPLGDPMLPVPAMAAATSRLGFGITVSVSYEHPYALARRFATLDHLTKGRVGWNVVTGYLASAAANLGLGDQLPHDQRYEMAEEYLEVCYKLWEGSWEDDAVVRDAERGVYTDPAKVHDVAHHGTWFDVPGPFLCEPSPQRTPTIFQAGASSRGQAFAGRHAEAVFVSGPSTTVVAKSVAGIRAAAAEAGRDPESVTIFVQLAPVVAPTAAEARKRYDEYLAVASQEGALALFGGWTGLDLGGLDPHEPLRHVETDAGRSALASFTTDDPDREWTLAEVTAHLAVGGRGPVVVGSPTEVADAMEHWVDETGADGFNLAYAVTPGTFVDVARLVVPELRRRGRMPAIPPAGTLREVLGGAGPRAAKDHPAAGHRR
ncbi:N5,N10-methylene tetrahydromethanopterin reductase [Actinomycetospora sp. NBRC 106375]|uniref:LLM class flavin-dependent oxidoreductase n=1 Tax=Actinomycetospora sp. NBRC 106375 TaxID=3032207 RepID=UPI0024A385D5|nr:LLM class flavin-dependent oxidoreductase [Actinomycetospora sp. NBRC 106375]GLZ47765.1 N5,N10-methylene tetrahydromethanopterin reductase [Actinomycetospora sp. NBRC 106375]